MDALDEHMKSIRLTQKRIQNELNSALVWKNVIRKRYVSEAERRDKLLKAERYNSLQSYYLIHFKISQVASRPRKDKNQLMGQEYEKSKDDIIKECSYYKTKLVDLQKENEELLEKTRYLENEKEKITLELTKAQEECQSIRDFVELKSARESQPAINQTHQQENNNPTLELTERSSSSLNSSNLKQSVIPSDRRESAHSSISSALPNLIQSYEQQINDLSNKLEFLQKKYDKDMNDWDNRYRRLEKAYDDLRSRYTKVQADFIEKEYLL